MPAASTQSAIGDPPPAGRTAGHAFQARPLVFLLSLIVIVYAVLAGLRTVTDFDLGWQLATGRWIVEHGRVPSTEVFSYTAAGRPWIYPAGSGILFYLAYVLGGYALLSWVGAAACAGTVALSLRRSPFTSAIMAVIAIPLIAERTTPRAEMFTVLLFAAFLALLLQYREDGRAPLWLFPVLMTAWVNLHLGFIAGLALVCAYAAIEGLETIWADRCERAQERLWQFWPWGLATFAATLINPWGWNVYQALIRQDRAMTDHSRSIAEWSAVPVNWTVVAAKLSLRNPGGTVYLLLLIALVATAVAVIRKQLGEALLLAGAALLTLRHVRFEGLFAVVVVTIAGRVLGSAYRACSARQGERRLAMAVPAAIALCAVALACIRSVDLVTKRTYLRTTTLASFGAGLSWWFPERAAAFIEREKIRGQIFNEYNEGGYIAWRLGPQYRDYIDGRAIPFGPKLFRRNSELVQSLPDSPEWQHEAERYDISTIVLPLGRYDGLQFFPVLQQFCNSASWRPVYLDETSVVFVRQGPDTEALIQRHGIDCATAPIPAIGASGTRASTFNRWANAAAVLLALGRTQEAFAATSKALAIFPDSAFVHFLRGKMLAEAGNLGEAERQYAMAAALEPNAASWANLGEVYRRERRTEAMLDAWERAADFSARPAGALLTLGYAYLDANRPEDARRRFEQAERNLTVSGMDSNKAFLANLAHGRAAAFSQMGNLKRAIAFEEETLRLRPDRADDWQFLAELYQREGRFADAQRARDHIATTGIPTPPMH